MATRIAPSHRTRMRRWVFDMRMTSNIKVIALQTRPDAMRQIGGAPHLFLRRYKPYQVPRVRARILRSISAGTPGPPKMDLLCNSGYIIAYFLSLSTQVCHLFDFTADVILGTPPTRALSDHFFIPLPTAPIS